MSKKITLEELENGYSNLLGSSTNFIKNNPIKSFTGILPIVSSLLAGVYFEGKRRGKGKKPYVEIWED